GYCYEHNLLFCYALQAMGFQVIPLPARVLKHHSEGDIPPKTHILLQVLIGEDKFLVDVGFGKETLTGPIPFKMDKAHPTPHKYYRIQKKSKHYLMQCRTQRGWGDMYRVFCPGGFILPIVKWPIGMFPPIPILLSPKG